MSKGRLGTPFRRIPSEQGDGRADDLYVDGDVEEEEEQERHGFRYGQVYPRPSDRTGRWSHGQAFRGHVRLIPSES